MTTLIIIAGIIIAGMGWAIVAQRREIDLMRDLPPAVIGREYMLELEARQRFMLALQEIERATRNGKSGTARMVHRMAKKALDV